MGQAVSLQSKIIRLKMDAVVAARHASFWQRAIDTHGEDKATAFYTHLGLNHLEKKSFDFEGLTLSREPKEHEKLAVKGIASAQESSKEAIGNILLSLRTELITDGLEGIKKLKPATYHELILEAPKAFRDSLRERLIEVHLQGRLLVAAELHHPGKEHDWALHKPFRCYDCLAIPEAKEAVPDDEFDDLDEITDLTLSRVVNDTQARIIGAASEARTLGISGTNLITTIQTVINAGSVSYIDRIAGGASNRVIGIGRGDEMRSRSDDIGRYEYSALLDVNTCDPCAALDGTTAENMDDLPEVPLADCDGGSLCRCFIIAVTV